MPKANPESTAWREDKEVIEDEPEALLNSLLEAGDVMGAQAEFERLALESLDSGEPVVMTRENWEEFRLQLHREAGIP